MDSGEQNKSRHSSGVSSPVGLMLPLSSGSQRNTRKKDSSFTQRYVRDETLEGDCISLDHCYSKNWNSQSDSSHAQTAKYVTWTDKSKREKSSAYSRLKDEEIVDIETVSDRTATQFDMNKARTLMTECERHMRVARPHHSHSTEDPINRSGWTTSQNKLFNRVYKVLISSRLARLANSGSDGEPVQRRLYADKCAKRIRSIFSGVFWDEKLLSWLHTTCMNNISATLLSDYLEVLQTLKSKVPTLIEKIITASDHRQKASAMSNEALDLLLKRSWDPITTMPAKGKPEKLPKNPMILIVPQLPQLDHNLPPNKGKRSKLWNNQLSNIAKIKHIPSPNIGKLTDHWECFDEMVVAVKAAIIETRETYPNKPIILLGWNFGALLAVYVASMEKVTAVVALGYPMLGLNGLRGDADDVIMDCSAPILFVVGEHAQTCPIDDLENMREKMRAENNLIVISGANDKLSVNFKTKKERNITQSVVDRCILDEVATYLARVLTTPVPQVVPSDTQPGVITAENVKKKKIIPSITGRKVITTIKGIDNANIKTLPKKRKSPMKDVRQRKAMRISKNQHIIPIPSVQEQMGSVTGQQISTVIGQVTGILPQQLTAANFRNLQPASSSSHGSLTSLKPISLTIPQLSGSSETNLRETMTPIKQEANIYSVSASKKDTQSAGSLPAYIQLSGHAGQGYAITMDKARELLNMGVIKGIERSKAGDIIGNYETTRQLLSLPPGTPISFTNAAYIGSSSSTHSIGSSRRGSGSNQSSDTHLPTTGITVSATASTATPTTITLQSSGGAQQIRQLLSIDGRLVYPAATTTRPRSMSTNSSPSEKGPSPAGPSPVPAVSVPLNSSPGKSLIKRTPTPIAVSSPQIVSAVSRQLLSSPSMENPTNKAISIVLNSNTSKATESAIINSLSSQGLGIKTAMQELSASSVPTAFDNLITPRIIETPGSVASKITSHGTLPKPVIIRSSGASKEADGTYIMRSGTSGSMQWPSHSIVAVSTTATPASTVHTPTVSEQLFSKDGAAKPSTESPEKEIMDSAPTAQPDSANVAHHEKGQIPCQQSVEQNKDDMIVENQLADKTSPAPDMISIGSSTLSADFSAEEVEPLAMDKKQMSEDNQPKQSEDKSAANDSTEQMIA